MSGPLDGVRVLDFTWVGAGSLTTKLLADHGADVIKVESRSHLDSLRTSPPFAGGVREGVDRSGYFAERNTSKRSLCLNLRTGEGRALARRLVATADVVANNFRPGVMEKFGLGYADLAAEHPGLIYLSMSMQGAEGPHSEYLGYGLTIGALVGLHDLTGLPDRYPCGTGTNYPDHVPNPGHAAFAVLAAVRHRRRTGEGQLIDIAQTEPTIAALGPSLLHHLRAGVVERRDGNRHAGYVFHDVLPCADAWVAISAQDEAQWRALCELLGGAPTPERTGAHDARALMEALQARGVAAAVVQDVAELVERDPQLAHRGHWQRLEHAVMGESLYGAPPFRLSATPGGLRSAAPLLGEHTAEVLNELLGLPEDEIAALEEQEILW
jgi:benzylsuccinate CoA-transferase BbsF subunit